MDRSVPVGVTDTRRIATRAAEATYYLILRAAIGPACVAFRMNGGKLIIGEFVDASFIGGTGYATAPRVTVVEPLRAEPR